MSPSPSPEAAIADDRAALTDGPAAQLDEMRARLAGGEHLVGSFAAAFHRTIAAVDPGATEDTIAVLPGNQGLHIYDSLVAWTAPAAGERVLDIGCGTGGAAGAAARMVGEDGEVVGVDPVPEALALAARRTPDDLAILYHRAAAERLAGMPDRYFDCAVLSFVLDQVADLKATLSELYRVLRPGGRWCASVWAFDKLRPLDQSLYGALIAVVARHAPGALAGAASRASMPHEREHMAAFVASELLRPEERDGQLALVMEDIDTAMAVFSRTAMVMMLSDEGREDFRETLARRLPHTLYLPVRLLRSRRPG
jgi:ubiquinone/menaquinone biosynthesis C-methylase UbiE